MSADNYVGVLATEDGKYGVIPYGNMSMLEEDCMYRGSVVGAYLDTRAEALVKAHDAAREMGVCEYGVIELEPVPDEPCGRCYICINDRGIVAEDIERCDVCGEPFTSSDWVTYTQDKQMHGSCEDISLTYGGH